jgi:hypothetical protein
MRPQLTRRVWPDAQKGGSASRAHGHANSQRPSLHSSSTVIPFQTSDFEDRIGFPVKQRQELFKVFDSHPLRGNTVEPNAPCLVSFHSAFSLYSSLLSPNPATQLVHLWVPAASVLKWMEYPGTCNDNGEKRTPPPSPNHVPSLVISLSPTCPRWDRPQTIRCPSAECCSR